MNMHLLSQQPSLNIPSPNLSIKSLVSKDSPVLPESNLNSKTGTLRNSNSIQRTITSNYFKLIRTNTKDHTSLIHGTPVQTDNNYNISALHSASHNKRNANFIKPKAKHELLQDYIKVREITRYEHIEEQVIPNCKTCLIPLISSVLYIKNMISESAELICKNWVFESFIMLVIICNTFTLAFDSILNIENSADLVFLVIYTIEAILKILSDGLVFPQNSYLKNKWNILDLLIVLTGWIQEVSVNLNSLRALRILRPLRNISSIKGMKVIFMALIKAAKHLFGILGLLFLFILIFSIAGLETMMGSFRNRCFDLETSETLSDEYLCGYMSCDGNLRCVESLENPNKGISNFDNIFSAIVMVFECVTLQTWVSLMSFAIKTSGPFVMIYYIPLAFIGAFIILNLTLATIKSAFTNSMKKIKKIKEKIVEENEEILDYTLGCNDNFEDSPEMNNRKRSRGILLELEKQEEADTNRGKTVAPAKRLTHFHDSDDDQVYIHEKKIRKILARQKSIKNSRRISDENKPFLHKSKSSLVINVNHLDFTEDINEKKKLTRMKIKISGMATKIFNVNTEYREQVLSLSEHFDTSYFLPKLKNSIKIQKRIVKKLKEGLDINRLKILLSEGYSLITDSKADILPELEGFEALDYSSSNQYLFSYKGAASNDKLELKWLHDSIVLKDGFPELNTNLAVFTYLYLKIGSAKAFSTIVGQALERIRCIEFADQLTGRVEGHWSGFDVDFELHRQLKYSERLSSMSFRIWSSPPLDKYEKLKFVLNKLDSSKVYTIFIMICVIFNSCVLSLDYYGISPELEDFLIKANLAFTIIFTTEICIKLIALNPSVFIRDTMNFIDSVIIILSWLEVSTNYGSSAYTAFRMFRVFRLFRVIKVVRVFRYLKFMKNLVKVITNSLPNFIYLVMLLLLLTTIYALLGVQLFYDSHGTHHRSNFQNFSWAYLSVFQVITLSSYSEVLYSNMESKAGPWSALYVIILIIIGNFILLNLFIAILLDSFMAQSNEVEKLVNNTGSVFRKSTSMQSTANEKYTRTRQQEKMKIIEAMNCDNYSSLDQPTTRSIYDNLDCDLSYNIFSKESATRLFCFRLVKSKIFNIITILAIALNCCLIVWETYLIKDIENNQQVKTVNIINLSLAVYYFFEFAIKSITFGLIEGKNSYIKDTWNCLDLIITITSLFDSCFLMYYTTSVKLRILRTFRPIKLISKLSSLKSIIEALISSLSAIINVIVVLFIVWFMFAILGVSLFAGKMYSCENKDITNQADCLAYGYKWINAEANFDNVLEAFLTLFIVSLLELWHEIMYNCIDAKDIGESRQKNYNVSASWYFIIFIIVGSFYFLKLFMGVLFFKFHEAKKFELSPINIFLNEREIFWVDMQKFIIKSSVEHDIVKEPLNPIRKLCHVIVSTTAFHFIIAVSIILNIITLSMNYYNADQSYLDTLDFLNIIFMCIFFLEAVLKILSLGFKPFFSHGWNVFDFFVVVCGIIDVIINTKNLVSTRFLRTGPQIIRIFRILRITRLLRVFKPLKTLNNLVKIVSHSISNLIDVSIFLLLFLFIFSAIGVYLFNHVEHGLIIDDHSNFSTFPKAFLILLYCSTLCDWPLYLYDCSESVGKLSSGVFFFFYMSTTIFVIINLIIMVIVQNYEEFELDPSCCLHVFTKEERKFQKNWENFSRPYDGQFIHYKNLPDFMYDLGDRLGFSQKISYQNCIRLLSNMDFYIENDGTVSYKDLFFSVLKRKYAPEHPSDRIAQFIIKNEEAKTVKRLKQPVLTYWGLTQKNRENQKYLKKQTKKLLAELVFIRKIFEAWKRVSRDEKQFRNFED